MEMTPQCIPCLLSRTLYETDLVNPDKKFEVIMAGLEILAKEFKPGVNSAEVATIVHEKAYEILGASDPYDEIKKRSNRAALELYSDAEKYIEESDNQLLAAMKCAIAGNVIDFGIKSELSSPEDLIAAFKHLIEEELAINHIDGMKDLLRESGTVLYFTDNCGEIVFDRLLLRELKTQYNIKIVLIVRGEPILTDATMEDVDELGLRELVDEVTTTNAFAVGVNFEKIDDTLRNWMGECDLIIAKGMANYESFSDASYKPIIYLMRTKCQAIADSIGAPIDRNVAKLYK